MCTNLREKVMFSAWNDNFVQFYFIFTDRLRVN